MDREEGIKYRVLIDRRLLKILSKEKVRITARISKDASQALSKFRGKFMSPFIDLALKLAFIIFAKDIKSKEYQYLISHVVAYIQRTTNNDIDIHNQIVENIRVLSDSLFYGRYVDLDREHVERLRELVRQERARRIIQVELDKLPEKILSVDDVLDKEF